MAAAEREDDFEGVMSEEARERDGRDGLVAAAAAAAEELKGTAVADDKLSLFSRVPASLLSS